KNRKRRNRKKKKKSNRGEVSGGVKPASAVTDTESEVEVEYVTAEPEIFDTNFIYFKRIFETFRLTDDVKKDKDKEPDKADKLESAVLLKKKGLEAEQKGSSDEDEDVDSDEDMVSLSLQTHTIHGVNCSSVSATVPHRQD
ncbi:hypothetical protein chiPu_0029884, partial [Chiloscyllium punctatum]|nr:hypothetical protein [Chiloscyllium punctatum]